MCPSSGAPWGRSSVGRASPWQGEGHRFKSVRLHHFPLSWALSAVRKSIAFATRGSAVQVRQGPPLLPNREGSQIRTIRVVGWDIVSGTISQELIASVKAMIRWSVRLTRKVTWTRFWWVWR